MTSLPTLAALTIAFLVFVYVVLDGFDIGVGLLLLIEPSREGRDAMLRATLRSRYSSELWLAAAAVTTYFAFPFPFVALAEDLAIPIIAMLVALTIRPLAMAMRGAAGPRGEILWSYVFAVASFVVALAQGLCLGGYMQGVSIVNNLFVGGLFDWAAPFSFIVAIALAVGYALLGATWLIFRKPEYGALEAENLAVPLSIAACVAMAVISIATLTVHPIVSARWGLSTDGIYWPAFLPLAPLPIATAICLGVCWTTAHRSSGPWPFLTAIGAFALGYAGLAIDVWPYVVPYGFTAAQSAADAHELSIILKGVAVAIPLLVMMSWAFSKFAAFTRKHTC